MPETPPSGLPPIEPEPYDREAEARRGSTVRDVGREPPRGDVSSARAWAMACHIGGLACFANVCCLFGLGIVVPLLIWLAQRDRDPFVDQHGKEAVNFQINVLLWSLILVPLSWCLIGLPLVLALNVAVIVLVVLASIEAAEGRTYRYPLTVRFVT